MPWRLALSPDVPGVRSYNQKLWMTVAGWGATYPPDVQVRRSPVGAGEEEYADVQDSQR